MANAALAEGLRSSSPMSFGALAATPPGWTAFCVGNAQDCRPAASASRPVSLDAGRLAELDRVNRAVNEQVAFTTDRDAFGVDDLWTYPTTKGDCEDFVLLKRRRLSELGWPRAALLVTVVRARRGGGHALLTVVTDRGDYVLDNRTNRIRPWAEAPYAYVKRQSVEDPSRWVDLGAR